MNYTKLKFACYTSSMTMSVVSNLSPLLFLSFHTLYDISFTKLGLLVLINFATQLLIDLIFSFFSKHFNITIVLRAMPILAVMGLFVMGLSPYIFGNSVYLGLMIGTVIFAASAGLSEVLTSPVIAAIPSKNPESEMSKLHSIYAFGVVFVVTIATLYLHIFTVSNWPFLPMLFTIIPMVSAILFALSDIPQLQMTDGKKGSDNILKDKLLWVSFIAIFLAGASECIMSQWVSSYLEISLNIPKAIGDIFGVALFSLFLGLGRLLYAKRGKNIERVLLISAITTSICYILAGVSPFPIIGLLASALTGFTTAMLWPGNLIVAEKRFPTGGVVMFALMAAGGDLGASLGPQLTGVITDSVIQNSSFSSLAATLSISTEQLGMRMGLILGALFPLIAIPVFFIINKTKNKKSYE